MAEYRAQFWSIELPEGWSASREDESILLEQQEGGAGTLSITLLCDDEPVDDAQLRELAASTLEEGHSAQQVEVGGYRGLYFSYQEEDTAWREWYLPAGNCLFFVSYDAPAGAEGREAALIESMMASLRHHC